MGEDSAEGDVGRLDLVRVAFAVASKQFDELVDEVRVRAAVAGALGKTQMLFSAFTAINTALGERRDFGRQQVTEVRAGDFLRDFGFRLFGGVDHEGAMLDERPFDRLLRAIDLDAFAILTRDIKQRAIHLGTEIAVFEADVGSLDSKGRPVAGVHFLTDGSGRETTDIFGLAASKSEHGADAMGGIVHGGKAGPVSGPAVHVLLVAGFEELQLSKLALIIEFLHEEKFAGVDHGLHHHVFESGFAAGIDDRLAIFSARRHRHSAGHVLAGAQGFEGVFGVIGDGGVDVDGVDVWIREKGVVVGVAFGDAKLVAYLIQGIRIALAEGDDIGIWMALVDGNELGAEAEANDRDAWV